jgi:uncharacterized protein YqeY
MRTQIKASIFVEAQGAPSHQEIDELVKLYADKLNKDQRGTPLKIRDKAYVAFQRFLDQMTSKYRDFDLESRIFWNELDKRAKHLIKTQPEKLAAGVQQKREIIAELLKAQRPDLANEVAGTTEANHIVTAADWLPNLLDASEKQMIRGLVSNASKTIKWDVLLAGAIAVALLEDVNAHSEARAVNDLLSKTLLTDA